jgi:hypothetical protein
MTNVTTLEFKKTVTPIEEEEIQEQPKYARMSFDQVTDMNVESLLIPISIREMYKDYFTKFPGLKYIKDHIHVGFMNGIRF